MRTDKEIKNNVIINVNNINMIQQQCILEVLLDIRRLREDEYRNI